MNTKSPILKTVISVVVTVVAVEIAASVLAIFLVGSPTNNTIVAQEDPVVGWRFYGCRDQKTVGLGDFNLCFDKNGLRVKNAGDESPTEQIALGSSIVLGQQVDASKTFAAQATYANAGSDGYTVYQMRDRFLTALQPLNPKKLLLVAGGDDFITEDSAKSRIQSTLWLNPFVSRSSPVLEMIKHEGVFRLIAWRIAGEAPTEEEMNARLLDLVSKPANADAFADWSAAVKAIQASGINMTILLSPPKAQVAAYKNQALEFARDTQVKEFAKSLSIPVIEPLRELSKEDVNSLYVDSLHYSEAGHATVGKALNAAKSLQTAG